MDRPAFSPDTLFAIQAVSEAVQLARSLDSGAREGALSKTDRSPVTLADLAVQALVAFRLREFDGDERLVAEESTRNLPADSGDVLSQASKSLEAFLGEVSSAFVREWIDSGDDQPVGRFWTLDPIDGTKGFLRGGQYATALALIDDGQVQAGVVGCPHLGRTPHFSSSHGGVVVAAERGTGCWLIEGSGDHGRLCVSQRREPSQARLLRSVEAGHTDTELFSRIASSLGTVNDPVLMDSQAKYSVMAAGAGDILFRLLSPKAPDYREKIWDQAAGSIVVEEAGGKISDLTGRALDFSQGSRLELNRGVAASNGWLHEAALKALEGADDRV